MMTVITHKETLIYYDEPQLFLAQDKANRQFLCLLADSNEESVKYISVKISIKRLDELYSGLVDLRDIFEHPEEEQRFYIEIKPNNQDLQLIPLSLDQFPEEWLPEPGFYFESSGKDQEHVNEDFEKIRSTGLTPYHAKYISYQLTQRYSSDNLEKLTSTLSDAQVDLNPHQVEAALFAFRSPFSKGAILADEVGLGKTIEAGIVISQKWAERKRKVLIIVPSSLRKQWNQELAEKFFLPSAILESKNFNKAIKQGEANPFIRDEIVICSYHFARSKEPHLRAVHWDLAVIDEAHRLRNVYKPSNKIANSIKKSIESAPKILLTATPLQNSLMELYGLVSIIDEYIFGDKKSFRSQFTRITDNGNFDDLKERLEPICKRTLRRQVREYIKFTNRICITQEFFPTPEEDRLYHLVSDYLQQPILYALPASQRQLMTLILRKLLASSTYAISGTLESLAQKLESVVEQHAPALSVEGEIENNFETYEELADEWSEEEPEFLNGNGYTPDDINLMKAEMESLREFYELAESIRKNSKGEALLTALKNGFEEAQRIGAYRKAIIFTESRRTQEYLKNILEGSEEYRGKIVLFNGSNNDDKSKEIYARWLEKYQGTDKASGSRTADMRAAIVEYFRDEAIIMIATEAAAEGINLQFCSMVVNYDLPWNPQRIEQRIGRCHRYGQKYDVVVVNFLNKKNAADQRVYELLKDKFQLFEGVFGASDEVLGAIESGVDFEKQIAQIYQESRTEDEIQASFNALQKELEQQISEKMQSAREELLTNFDEEVHEKLRVHQENSQLYLNKYENWLWRLTQYYLEPYARFEQPEYSFYLVKNPFPNERIHPGPYRIGKHIEDANIYRVGHLLAQRILEQCKSLELKTVELAFHYSGTPKITILEPQIGKSGWLTIINLTITAFETEDHLLLCGVNDEGNMLDIEQCQRLFSLPAKQLPPKNGGKELLPPKIRNHLEEIAQSQQAAVLQMTAERNAHFFENEMEKLDKWAEDLKNSLELELKQLDVEIKTRKTEARKLIDLKEKVQTQREIKELEKKRNTKRFNLFKAQDGVDQKKEDLIAGIEQRLQQKIDKTELFTIKWYLF